MTGFYRRHLALRWSPRSSPGLSVGSHVRTRFGSMTVSDVQVNNGLSAEDVGGMTHGISSMVGSGKAQVNVVVTLWNHSRMPLAVAPDRFALAVGTPEGKPVALVGSTLPRQGVAAGASIEARLTWTTATDGSPLWLRFADGGAAGPARVALGSVAKVRAPVGVGHGAAHGGMH